MQESDLDTPEMRQLFRHFESRFLQLERRIASHNVASQNKAASRSLFTTHEQDRLEDILCR